MFSRTSGVLLHPTSLPGRYGIGDLGDSAYHFVDFLNMQNYLSLSMYKDNRLSL